MSVLFNNCIKFAQSLLPTHCACCGLPAHRALCHFCVPSLPLLGNACLRCAQPIATGKVCGGCLNSVSVLASITAHYRYADPLRRLITGFKHQGRSMDATLLANLMWQSPPDLPLSSLLFVPVPLHADRLRWRGYHQSLLLAQRLAKLAGAECLPKAVVKHRATSSQQGLDRRERLKNLQAAFEVRDMTSIVGRDIILIDDVMTTGATLETLAKVLRQAGASAVHGWVLARAV